MLLDMMIQDYLVESFHCKNTVDPLQTASINGNMHVKKKSSVGHV